MLKTLLAKAKAFPYTKRRSKGNKQRDFVYWFLLDFTKAAQNTHTCTTNKC